MSTTTNTQNAIIDFLNLSGHFSWRNNTQGTYDPVMKVFRGLPRGMKGAGDILCCLRGGRLLEVEFKSKNDRMSPEQIRHKQRIIDAGGLYVTAGSYDEFRRYYDQVIAPLYPRGDQWQTMP
jgi:hypothetical protein